MFEVQIISRLSTMRTVKHLFGWSKQAGRKLIQ
jgi:hypothetical protein